MVCFRLGAVFGLLLCGLGVTGVFSGPQQAVLPLGLPDLPFHLRLDALSAFFLCVLGAVSAGVRVLRRLFPQGRGHAARTAVLPVPRVPREHGASCCWPTMLMLHGGVGDDGAVVVSSWS